MRAAADNGDSLNSLENVDLSCDDGTKCDQDHSEETGAAEESSSTTKKRKRTVISNAHLHVCHEIYQHKRFFVAI